MVDRTWEGGVVEDFMKNMLFNQAARQQADRETFDTHDPDLCMLCHAQGADKRSLKISCLYDIKEVVPEALDLKDHFYLLICKSCRAKLLAHLEAWRNECLALQSLMKDHDGHIDIPDERKNIPVRINGAIVMMNEEEYQAFKQKKGLP